MSGCILLTRAGAPCRNEALPGDELCGVHLRVTMNELVKLAEAAKTATDAQRARYAARHGTE